MPPPTTRLTPALIRQHTVSGAWPNTTFSAELARIAATSPDQTAVVDDRVRLSYAELDRATSAVARGLLARGLRPGETLSSILPNRAEAVVLFYAASRIGLVLNPIIPIYGARELRFILRQAESAAVVVAPQRGTDHLAVVNRLCPELPHLRHVWMVGDRYTLPVESEAPAPMPPVDPNAVSCILYTSGTTADPKGVLHSNNTLLAECRAMVRYHGLSAGEVFIMPSPVGHISGLLYGVMLPVVLGATSVLMERWEPRRFLELTQQHRGTYSAGATPFLQGVVDAPELAAFDVSSLRLFPCGGADVPPELIRRAIQRLGVRSGRGYGSTEHPSITSSAGPDVPDVKRATTDGAPIGDNEIELRDLAGRPVVCGEEGEIWSRGSELFLGYRDATLNADAFDERGFFRSGDLGVLDADGYLTITGRRKDIIIRRGEKISAKELEDLLHEHPKVGAVAVIPSADAQVGERICAVVVPAGADCIPTLAELVAFLEMKEVSRRKLPERLEIVDALPLTASGKVLKHVLRERFG
jgi:cyclohexanecarboxylate-CoA ligase